MCCDRCRNSVELSIRCVWLLSAYAADVPKPNWKNSQGVKLKQMIVNEELRWVTVLVRCISDSLCYLLP